MTIKMCPKCGKIIDTDDEVVILMPYPHVVCPDCGEWIVSF